jgi:Protein of unknown function (DUF4232)
VGVPSCQLCVRSALCSSIAVIGLGTAACTSATPPTRVRSPAPASTRVTTASAVAPPRCEAAELRATIKRRGSNASAPFIVVKLTGHRTGCTVNGYPRIAAYSASGNTLALTTRHGTYEVADPGPRRVIVSPGRAALFALGTSTGYGRHPVVIARVDIPLPDAASGSIHLSIPGGLGATAPGRRVTLGLTAFSGE